MVGVTDPEYLNKGRESPGGAIRRVSGIPQGHFETRHRLCLRSGATSLSNLAYKSVSEC